MATSNHRLQLTFIVRFVELVHCKRIGAFNLRATAITSDARIEDEFIACWHVFGQRFALGFRQQEVEREQVYQGHRDEN